jgi:hypothetical protein
MRAPTRNQELEHAAVVSRLVPASPKPRQGHLEKDLDQAARGRRCQRTRSHKRRAGVHVASIVDEELTVVVRRAFQSADLQVLHWELGRAGRAGNPVSVGVHRLAGWARNGRDVVPWSVVLKIVQPPAAAGSVSMSAGADAGHWNYWRREIEVYRSGLLADLPRGIGAPRCFGIGEHQGGTAWLWLEDVADAEPAPWREEQYRQAARHLGRLNAHHLFREPPPMSSWLSVGLLRQWCAAFSALNREARGGAAFRGLLFRSDSLFDALDSSSHSFSHRDGSPANLMTRHCADGSVETVALDWGLAGIAPLGEELAALSVWAAAHLPPTDLADWEAGVFESYVDGLRDCAWRGDLQAVRLSYVATAALRVGLWMLRPARFDQEVSDDFVEGLAAEALELLNVTA